MSVSCRHLLIKHTGSRNPISRRTGKTITLSKEDALAELKSERAAIVSAGNPAEAFAQRAIERSDCGSYKSGGDLGSFGRGEMQAPFEQAAFALDVGAISDVVDSDSGLHIILREA